MLESKIWANGDRGRKQERARLRNGGMSRYMSAMRAVVFRLAPSRTLINAVPTEIQTLICPNLQTILVPGSHDWIRRANDATA